VPRALAKGAQLRTEDSLLHQVACKACACRCRLNWEGEGALREQLR
jgi:hypothetical protein